MPAGPFSFAAAIAASSLTLPACGPAREAIEHPQHERLQKFLQPTRRCRLRFGASCTKTAGWYPQKDRVRPDFCF